MNNNRSVLILPQTPTANINYGKFVPPILADILSSTIGGKFHYCINLLDSFNERELLLDKYIKNIEQLKINYSDLWIDTENVDDMIKNIVELSNKGFIQEINTTLFRCQCGKIEIEENKINTCNPCISNFYVKNGIVYSKCCNCICEKSNEKILAFVPNKNLQNDLKFFPQFFKNDSKTYENTILNSYVMISRKRNTGIKLKYNGKYYNIDIDFLWSTYLATFEETEKIVVTGNKMMYQLFMVGILERILKPQNDTILLGIPVISDVNKFLGSDIDPNVAKLALAFNMRWNNKVANFDNGILRKLYRTNDKMLEKIYNEVLTQACSSGDFYENVKYILNNNFNSQKILKKVKEMNKNV